MGECMNLFKTMYLLLIVLSVGIPSAFAQGNNRKLNVIMIGAHPDDCDLWGGGTAIKFAERGHRVRFVSMTNGDAGHHSMKRAALAKRRYAEAKEAGRRAGVEYIVLPNRDGELMPTLENRRKIIRLIREWKADLVITHRADDYHPDHRYAGVLVQDAAFMVMVPNIEPKVPPLKHNPVFMYFRGRVQGSAEFKPAVAVNIDDVIPKKYCALDAHVSQVYEFLPRLFGFEKEVPRSAQERLKWFAKKRPFEAELNALDRKVLVERYGKKKAQKVVNAETFELSPFGTQPTRAQLKELFPF